MYTQGIKMQLSSNDIKLLFYTEEVI